MASRGLLSDVPNKDISQMIKQAASEVHGEGDEIRFRSFNR